jgi:hypothetical protein
MDKIDKSLLQHIELVSMDSGDLIIFDGRIPHGPTDPPTIDVSKLRGQDEVEGCLQIRTYFPYGAMFTETDPFGGQLHLYPFEVASSYFTGVVPAHYAFGHSNNHSAQLV